MAAKITASGLISYGTAYVAAKYFSLSKPHECAVVVVIHSLICRVAEQF